jgi:hypothetical protein
MNLPAIIMGAAMLSGVAVLMALWLSILTMVMP